MPDWKPQEVSDVEIAFPAHALKLMPAWEEIPDKFKHMSTARSGELDDSYGISTVWAGPVSGQE